MQLGQEMHLCLLVCQYGTNRGQIFAGPLSPSTLRRSVILKMATLHVLPRPNRPTTNLTGGLPLQKNKTKQKEKRKKKKKAQTLNSAGPPSASVEQFLPPLSSVSSRQDLPRSQCSLEKMSLVGRSRHDYKTQAREELWFELSHSLCPFTSH